MSVPGTPTCSQPCGRITSNSAYISLAQDPTSGICFHQYHVFEGKRMCFRVNETLTIWNLAHGTKSFSTLPCFQENQRAVSYMISFHMYNCCFMCCVSSLILPLVNNQHFFPEMSCCLTRSIRYYNHLYSPNLLYQYKPILVRIPIN